MPMMRKTRNTSTPITAPAIVFAVLLRSSDDRLLDAVGCNLALVAKLELDSEAISVFVLIDVGVEGVAGAVLSPREDAVKLPFVRL